MLLGAMFGGMNGGGMQFEDEEMDQSKPASKPTTETKPTETKPDPKQNLSAEQKEVIEF